MNGKSLSSMNARPGKSLNARPGPIAAPSTPIPATAAVKTQPAPQTQTYSQPKNVAPVKVQSTVRPQPAAAVAQTAPANAADVPDFVGVMRSMVGGFAILSEDTIQQNLKLASGQGMTADDRTVSFECADYLMSNLGYIFMGLVLDTNFKNAFMESLTVELNIDKQADDVKKKTRESMKDPHAYESTGSIILGVTTFTPDIETMLMNKMQKSFDALDGYADEFDSEVAKLTDQQKMEYGFIFSNFMYLIRAFTHNDLFMSYVITVIEKVKGIINGEAK